MMSASKHETREGWLRAAVDGLAPLFADVDAKVPRVQVSIGWPSRGGARSKSVGECWMRKGASDGVSHIFVRPDVRRPVEILAILTHEIVHAILDAPGHGKAFYKIATSVGLKGSMRATYASDDLKTRLAAIASACGRYPSGYLTASGGKKKQTTRLLKATCEECGSIIRLTQKVVDEPGLPWCACEAEGRFRLGD